jgi:hypothetical protein
MDASPNAHLPNTAVQNNIAHLLMQHASSPRILYKHFENETWNEYAKLRSRAQAWAWAIAWPCA